MTSLGYIGTRKYIRDSLSASEEADNVLTGCFVSVGTSTVYVCSNLCLWQVVWILEKLELASHCFDFSKHLLGSLLNMYPLFELSFWNS